MYINEITDFDKVLQHIEPKYQDCFCESWYHGLDQYKEFPESLLLVANAILNHWEVPLYVESIVGWDEINNCFIWHLRQMKQPQRR